jgi:aminoglycoside phosphotransferase (APT) family kinase protein
MIAVMDRDQITAEVAARLVAGQFPQWAGLPVVPVGLSGWDNITFRLGGELSVRLPSGEDYAAQVAKEHQWLPVLAGQLPLPVPEPVALGRPAAGFPWPWPVDRGRARAVCHRRQRWPAARTAQLVPRRLAEHLG